MVFAVSVSICMDVYRVVDDPSSHIRWKTYGIQILFDFNSAS